MSPRKRSSIAGLIARPTSPTPSVGCRGWAPARVVATSPLTHTSSPFAVLERNMSNEAATGGGAETTGTEVFGRPEEHVARPGRGRAVGPAPFDDEDRVLGVREEREVGDLERLVDIEA